MIFVKAWAAVLVSFLAIDVVWIGRVVKPMYDREVGDLLRAEPRMGAAAAFYVLYAAGVAYLAVLPALASGGLRAALVRGAIVGGLAYGTYAFTNHAVLRDWTFTLVAADVAWGVVLTAFTAGCGWFAARGGR